MRSCEARLQVLRATLLACRCLKKSERSVFEWLALQAVDAGARIVPGSHRTIAREMGVAENSVLNGSRALLQRGLIAIADPGGPTRPKAYDLVVFAALLPAAGAANSEAPQDLGAPQNVQGGASNSEAAIVVIPTAPVENTAVAAAGRGASNFAAPIVENCGAPIENAALQGVPQISLKLASSNKNSSEELASFRAGLAAVVKSRCRRFSQEPVPNWGTCKNLLEAARVGLNRPDLSWSGLLDILAEFVAREDAKCRGGGGIAFDNYGGLVAEFRRAVGFVRPTEADSAKSEDGVGAANPDMPAKRPPQMERADAILEALIRKVSGGGER